jgi:ABC-2 type transport system ATP-binding protein
MSPPQANPVVFAANRLSKLYDEHTALDNISLTVTPGRIIGLLGRNGAGKTTLLHVIAGLTLPSSGTAHTLGRDTALLDTPELTQIGLVMQEAKFIEWMTVRQHLDFTASFYPTWDRTLERRMRQLLEIETDRRIADLSTGDRQKVAILLGVCHRPELLLLDEPMSSLDPIVRNQMLTVLVDRLREDNCTIIVSSHLLEDVEKTADWVVALSAGRVVEDSAFDDLQESFSEWTVTMALGMALPNFDEPYIMRQERGGPSTRLIVRTREPDVLKKFIAVRGVSVKARHLSLDEIFPLLVQPRKFSK